MKVLVTGGAGYIGSHTVVALTEKGHDVLIIDNFSNSSPEALKRVEKITGKQIPYIKLDAADEPKVLPVFESFRPDAVIHFAGSKAVGESVEKPLMYYHNNIGSTISICEAAVKTGVKRFIFSSTASAYGNPKVVPTSEDAPLDPQSPYARTKVMCEQILRDAAEANPGLGVTLLRYFNPIGAHPSGLIGEDPLDIPNNLVPFISQVAAGKLERLRVFGDDYDTPDGTGVRDYLHVSDLAEGHVAALEYGPAKGTAVYNLGTGQGQSVLEMLHAFEKAVGHDIPHIIAPRRPGDVATSCANPAKAKAELQWQASRTLGEMCASAWKWQSTNPNGYR